MTGTVVDVVDLNVLRRIIAEGPDGLARARALLARAEADAAAAAARDAAWAEAHEHQDARAPMYALADAVREERGFSSPLLAGVTMIVTLGPLPEGTDRVTIRSRTVRRSAATGERTAGRIPVGPGTYRGRVSARDTARHVVVTIDDAGGESVSLADGEGKPVGLAGSAGQAYHAIDPTGTDSGRRRVSIYLGEREIPLADCVFVRNM